VALGVFLSDAVDTLEKYVLNFRDQDDEIAFYIRDNYSKLTISLDEVYELTYLAAIPEGKEEDVPDSSLRYFLTIDSHTGQSGLTTHLNFIEGKPYYPTAISYKRILVSEFYDYIKEKVMATGKPLALISPQEIIRGLDKSISEVMRTSILTLGPQVSLKDALSKLHKTKSELIIVQDEKKQVLGVIHPSDFLYLLRAKVKKEKY
jgi:CBS domain-containing protein